MAIREYEAFHRLLKIDNPQLKTLFTLLSPRKTQSTKPPSPSPPGMCIDQIRDTLRTSNVLKKHPLFRCHQLFLSGTSVLTREVSLI